MNHSKSKLVSDIHLELLISGKGVDKQQWELIAPVFANDTDADNLIIAGDLCTARLLHWFVDYLKPYFAQYKKVIYVAGNHEYWNETVEKAEALLLEFEQSFDNLFYLQDDYVIIDDVVFYGMTYWYNGLSPIEEWDMEQNLRDFKRIRRGNYKRTTPEYFTTINSNSVARFFEFVKTLDPEQKIALITHHPTSVQFYENGQRREAGYGYPLPLPYDFDPDRFLFCCHGHTHIKKTYKNEWGIPTYVNACGYIGYERLNKETMII